MEGQHNFSGGIVNGAFGAAWEGSGLARHHPISLIILGVIPSPHVAGQTMRKQLSLPSLHAGKARHRPVQGDFLLFDEPRFNVRKRIVGAMVAMPVKIHEIFEPVFPPINASAAKNKR